MKLFKSWQEKMIEEVEREAERNKTSTFDDACKTITKLEKVAELKKRIIKVLREKPDWLFGTTSVLIKSENHLLAHDVVKELRVELKRSVEDTFHYRGEYDGVSICIYGSEEVLGCKIVPKKVMKEVTVYELVCPEVARNG